MEVTSIGSETEGDIAFGVVVCKDGPQGGGG